jgi:hypothetical protein
MYKIKEDFVWAHFDKFILVDLLVLSTYLLSFDY